ncbi:hypothetical protein [Paenibacillus anseongense]|uniref:hypothetical protein n=1 Tax=Paenibacillus TaxID=44249 RepID=UPI002DB8EDEB|nr:hypothetical protein [Paenibacillus anseongense]MEC0266789.1 hypothetical protein [Paenibacillus anseongense]
MHPFMGIEQWDKIGMSVSESANRLHRLAYIDRRLARIEAGHLIARPEYELKGALARLVWQDASFHEQCRNRCRQLRLSTAAFDKCPDIALERLTNQVLDSANTLTLLVALFEVVKPAQLAAIDDYMQRAQPIVDEPTIMMLRHQQLDRQMQIDWGQSTVMELLQSASEEERRDAEKWKSFLEDLLQRAGGISGTEPRPEHDAVIPEPTISFELPNASIRDSRFRTNRRKFDGVTFEDNDTGRLEAMMLHRFYEMTATEALAYIFFSAESKPWAFHYDVARHLWDEARHSWFGEAALRAKGRDVYAIPNWTGFYEMCVNEFDSIDEAYTHLTIAIEKAAMKYPPGKREEWEFCRDKVQDPLMTTFQDFDWADEVVHAGFGQKWIIHDVHQGDQDQAQLAAAVTQEKRTRFMEREVEQAPSNKQVTDRFAGGY